MDNDANGVLEDFRIEFQDCWRRLPNKAFFFVLAAIWIILFALLGNSTLGYINSPSLFSWVLNAYHPAGDYFASDDGHGLIVPVIVLAIFWVKRKELMSLPLRTWWPGLLILALSLFLHLLGYMVQQPRISMIGFFTGLYGLMGIAWGPSWLRSSFFPFFLFAFCIPLSTQLQPVTFWLRLVVTKLVEIVAHFILAIDVIREGTALKDPTGRYMYEVAAACSGLRSMVATLGLAFCFGFLSFSTWWKRIIMIASAFPLAILGNLLRMLIIVIVADIWGQDAGNYVHEGGPGGIISLIPYLPAFFGLIYLEEWLKGKKPTSNKPGSGNSGGVPPAKPEELCLELENKC